MGNQFLDQYSILHFATGVVAYFWNVPLPTWFVAHAAFEVLENTDAGMDFINTNLKTWWPGGKPRADDILNIVGDNVAAVAGWWCAFQLDETGKASGWYSPKYKRGKGI